MPKKTERYTERSRPHRRDSRGDSAVADEGWRNPVVLIAIAGLIAAAVLVVGFFIGSRPGAQTAQAPTPGTEATGGITSTGGITATIGIPTSAAGVPTIAVPTSSARTFTAPEDQKLDPVNKSYFATIETARGAIVVELWPQLAPKTVNSFVFLARQGFYDGLTFHRVEPDFVIQGGDPAGNGTGGPGYSVPAEFSADNPVPHRAGTLAMARSSDPNSAGSQFYIVTEDSQAATALNGQYTVFGWVISGMKVVREIQKGDVMSKITIEEKPIADQVVTPDDIRAGKLPSNE